MSNLNITYLFTLLLALLLTQCTPKIDPSSVTSHSQDSTEIADTSNADADAYSEIERLEELADSLYNFDARTKEYVDMLHDSWKTTPKKLIVTYKMAEFGDYFHLIFTTPDGNSLDFGDAHNEFGEYDLINESNSTNLSYKGKKFNLTWDWKPSSFYCCQGDMDVMLAKIPTITSLELIN